MKSMEQTIQVEGMTCGHCKSSVEGALKKLNGVTKAEANIETGEVNVTFDDKKVKLAEMKEAIEDQGYDVK